MCFTTLIHYSCSHSNAFFSHGTDSEITFGDHTYMKSVAHLLARPCPKCFASSKQGKEAAKEAQEDEKASREQASINDWRVFAGNVPLYILGADGLPAAIGNGFTLPTAQPDGPATTSAPGFARDQFAMTRRRENHGLQARLAAMRTMSVEGEGGTDESALLRTMIESMNRDVAAITAERRRLLAAREEMETETFRLEEGEIMQRQRENEEARIQRPPRGPETRARRTWAETGALMVRRERAVIPSFETLEDMNSVNRQTRARVAAWADLPNPTYPFGPHNYGPEAWWTTGPHPASTFTARLMATQTHGRPGARPPSPPPEYFLEMVRQMRETEAGYFEGEVERLQLSDPDQDLDSSDGNEAVDASNGDGYVSDDDKDSSDTPTSTLADGMPTQGGEKTAPTVVDRTNLTNTVCNDPTHLRTAPHRDSGRNLLLFNEGEIVTRPKVTALTTHTTEYLIRFAECGHHNAVLGEKLICTESTTMPKGQAGSIKTLARCGCEGFAYELAVDRKGKSLEMCLVCRWRLLVGQEAAARYSFFDRAVRMVERATEVNQWPQGATVVGSSWS